MTFADFIKSANNYYETHKPDYRYGQAVYNHLESVRPEIAKLLVGTALDPYYGAVVAPDTWAFICENW